MTKLEQKLIELGYEKETIGLFRWFKNIKDDWFILMNLNCENDEIQEYWIDCYISTEQDMKDIQQAFNQLQNDLKELKKYENI